MKEVVLLRSENARPDPLDPKNDLPPVEAVPILEDYWRLGYSKFREKHAVETPVDDRGFVDYGRLLGIIDNLVDQEFRWPNQLDVHHLFWKAESYEPSHFLNEEDPLLPHRFREIAYHKILIPRQMHNLLHKLTIPSDVPDYKLMEKREAGWGTAVNLFQIAKRSLDVEAQDKRLKPLPKGNGYLDPLTKRTIDDREVLQSRYNEFLQMLHEKCTNISQQDVDNIIAVDTLKNLEPLDLLIQLDKRVFLKQKHRAIKPKLRLALSKAVAA